MDEICVAEDEGICNDERTIKTVAAPKLWNSLPLDIRNSGSITLFKCKDFSFQEILFIIFYKIFNCRIVKRHRAAGVYGAI